MGQRALIVLDTHAWIWYAAEDEMRAPLATGDRRIEDWGNVPVIW